MQCSFGDLDGKEQFNSKPKLGSLWTIYEIWLDFGPLYGLQSHLYHDCPLFPLNLEREAAIS